jgi:plasmid maintenance system antidote protein VapI
MQASPDSSGGNSSGGIYEPAWLVAECSGARLEHPASPHQQILLQNRGITADTAFRLGRSFGTTAELWTGSQADDDLPLARYERQREVLPLAP